MYMVVYIALTKGWQLHLHHTQCNKHIRSAIPKINIKYTFTNNDYVRLFNK